MAEKTVGFKIVLSGSEKTFENISQLREELNKVNKELEKAPKGSEEFEKLSQESAVLKTELNGVTKELKNQQKAFADTKFAAGSYRALNAELGKLRGAFKELSAEEIKSGKISDENVKRLGLTTNSVKELAGQINRLDKELKETDASLGNFQRNVGNYQSALGGLGGTLAKLAPGFAVFAGTDALLQAAQSIAQTTQEIEALQGQIRKLRLVPEEQLDEFTARVAAIGTTFDKELDDVLLSANAFSKQFGIPVQEAIGLIETGLVAGLDANNDFLGRLQEYPALFKQAGFTAGEFLAVIDRQIDQGVFSDKGLDTILEFGSRVTEQSTKTKSALENAFGEQFTKELFDNINNGSLSVQDALVQVSTKLDETQLPANELAVVVRDVFGTAGEEVGVEFLKSLKDIENGTTDLIDSSNQYQTQQQQLLAANQALAQSQVELAGLFEGAGNTFAILGANIQKFFIDLIVRVIQIFKPLVSAFQEVGRALSRLGSLFGSFAKEGEQTFSLVDALTGSLQVLSFVLQFIVSSFTSVVDSVREFIEDSPLLLAVFEGIGTAVNSVFDAFSKLPAVFAGIVAALKQLGTNFVNTFKVLAIDAEIFGNQIKEFFGANVDAAIADLRARRAQIAEESRTIGEAFSEAFNASLEQRKTAAKEADKVNEQAVESDRKAEAEKQQILKDSIKERDKLQEQIKKAKDNIENLKNELISDQFDREIAKATKAATDRIAALAGTVEQIKEQTDLINTLLEKQIEGIEKKRSDAAKSAQDKIKKAGEDTAKLILEQERQLQEAIFNLSQLQAQDRVQELEFGIRLNNAQLQKDISEANLLLQKQLASGEISQREFNEKSLRLQQEVSLVRLEVLKQNLEKEQQARTVANQLQLERLEFNLNAQSLAIQEAALSQEQKLQEQLDRELITLEQFEEAKAAIKANSNARLELLNKEFIESQAQIVENETFAILSAQQRLADEQLRIETEKNERIREQNQRTLDAIRDTTSASVNFLQSFVSGVKDLLQQDEKNREANKKRIQALSIAEIGINLANELGLIAISAQQAGLATGPAAPITAAIVYGIQAATAVTRAAFNIAKIKKAEEGMAVSGDSDFGNQNIRPNQVIVGNPHSAGGERGVFNGVPIEAEGGEFLMRNGSEYYIVNKKSTRKFGPQLRAISKDGGTKFNPAKRGIVSAINAYSGWGVKFQQGGALSVNPLSAPNFSEVNREVAPLLDKFDKTISLLTANVISTQENIAAVQESVNTITVINNPEETVTEAAKVKETKRVNNLTLDNI